MSEWWTYGLRDLLLFSQRTYSRLFELYNLEWWPLHLFALALGVAALVLWRRGGERAGRALAALLALGWLWVAWAFHWQRYASINLAAGYFRWPSCSRLGFCCGRGRCAAGSRLCRPPGCSSAPAWDCFCLPC